jgi:hypothetical protein
MIRIPIKLIDVEIVLAARLNIRQWAIAINPLEINVATPPLRYLNDVRFTLSVGPIKLGLILAHYRGEQQQYALD